MNKSVILCFLQIIQITQYIEFFFRSQNQVHAFNCRNLFRFQLCIATQDDHQPFRIGFHGAFHMKFTFAVSIFCHRTGVDDIHTGFLIEAYLFVTCAG